MSARGIEAAEAESTAAPRPGGPIRPENLIALQRQAGNRAVSRLVVARAPLDAGAGSGSGANAGSGAPVGTTKPLVTTPAAGAPAPAAPAPGGAAPAPAAPPPIAWIEALDPHIKRQIDTFSQGAVDALLNPTAKQRKLDERTANRITFMNTMRGFFGSDAATQSHFEDVKPMDNDKRDPLWAHVSTRERLLAVVADLKAQNHPMPQTDVGLGMRGDHLHPAGHTPGWFTHAAGYAVDWRVYTAPHLSDVKLKRLFETITGGIPQFQLMQPQTRLDLIEKMGQGTAAAADSQKLLQDLENEYNRVVAGVATMKASLPPANFARLQEVETARAALGTASRLLANMTRNKKFTKAQIDAVSATIPTLTKAFDDKKAAAVADLATIFAPWTALLDARIGRIEADAASHGVADFSKLSGRFGFAELDAKVNAVRKKETPLRAKLAPLATEIMNVHREATVLLAKVAAAKAFLANPGKTALPPDAATWSTDLDAVADRANAVLLTLDPLKQQLAAAMPDLAVPKPPAALKPSPVTATTVNTLGGAVDKLPARVTAAAGKLGPLAAPLVPFAKSETEIKQDIADRKAFRAERVTALGGGTSRAQQAAGESAVGKLLDEKSVWMDLKATKDALLTNANDFVFRDAAYVEPGVTQALGMKAGSAMFAPDPETGGEDDAKAGRWSDTQGFNLAFMKSMVSHGFELGVAWQDNVDVMHFELVEGRKQLESGGAHQVVAGQALAAQEHAAAALAAAAAAAAQAAAGAGSSAPPPAP